MDLDTVILAAKLGRARRDAQVDTCAVFAAALYDVLVAHEVPCRLAVATRVGWCGFSHSVIEAGGKYYDSMGEFSTLIYRNRAKIHPDVSLHIEYQPDFRCYEPDFEELYAFYVEALGKSVGNHLAPVEVNELAMQGGPT